VLTAYNAERPVVPPGRAGWRWLQLDRRAAAAAVDADAVLEVTAIGGALAGCPTRRPSRDRSADPTSPVAPRDRRWTSAEPGIDTQRLAGGDGLADRPRAHLAAFAARTSGAVPAAASRRAPAQLAVRFTAAADWRPRFCW
jgi:type IV pilus biogenesis protein CpaD/CtpE